MSFSHFQILLPEAGITIALNCYVLFFQLSMFYFGYTHINMAYGKYINYNINLIKNLLYYFPNIRKVMRCLFLWLRYLAKGALKFRCSLATNVLIKRSEEWAGLDKIDWMCFFGYYDKSPWNSNGDSYLCHRLCDKKTVELIVLKRGESNFLNIGKTQAWTYQQGSMLQWLPGSNGGSVIYNTIQNFEMGCCIHDITANSNRFIPWPVQALHPGGQSVISLNYSRLIKMNPEYGYRQKASNLSPDMPLKDDGLWLVNLKNGHASLNVSLETLLVKSHRECMDNADHGVNHVIFSPDGNKIIFIHRWLTKTRQRYSRLYVMDFKQNELKLLLDDDHVSHYCWLDDDNILTHAATSVEGKGYYQINVNDGKTKTVGKDHFDIHGDGHPGLSPDGRWIVTDTYPDAARIRRLLLWNLFGKYLVEVGKFYSPVSFENKRRCDLHPRWHPKEPFLSIDSAHEGVRHTYVLDVSSIVGSFSHE